MSAWVEEGQEQVISDIDKTFEDNFVSKEQTESNEFKKLPDSENYLQLLGKLLNAP